MTAVLQAFWSVLGPAVTDPARVACVQQIATAAEARRGVADYNTGSIAETEALLLWALAEHIGARVVLEVGTFIGTSTLALALASSVEAVYTCDVSNDCLPRAGKVHTYPKRTSSDMLADVIRRGVSVDLCFADGVLGVGDAALIPRATHPATVYAFHDYNYGPKIRRTNGVTYLQTMPRKGIGNVDLVRSICPDHVLITPYPETTLALLIPEAWL